MMKIPTCRAGVVRCTTLQGTHHDHRKKNRIADPAVRPGPGCTGQLRSDSTGHAQQVEKIAQMTEENSAAAQSAAEISHEMAGIAQELHGIVNKYRI
ncbi:MAG: methyl-accepting chemotaxis protein [Thauera sp.]|jgi:hypothetical protein|nr:methyl-accepting chemotaxis protein [Thauera sp.]